MSYIQKHDQSWATHFQEIRAFLVSPLPRDIQIHHVGSTSVPGMPAKPVIDIDIECRIGSMTAIIRSLAAIGYTHEGDRGIPTREAFTPNAGTPASRLPTHHLYACESDSAELRRHLAFRDYLRLHPKRMSWLAARKRAADEGADSRDQYIANKDDAYQVIVAEALGWVERTGS